MKKLLFALPLIALAGCNTMESAAPAMTALKGKPVQAVFAKIGYPDNQQTIAGKNVYTWGRHSTGSITLPTAQTATGTVNGAPVYATVSGTREESYDLSCTFKVIASKGDIIEHFQWDGNIGGCSAYADRLKK